MTNEVIFIITAVIDLAFILLAFRLGKGWLFGAIVVNIILVSTFAGKLVPIFGFVTNAAGVFYAAIFLATDILTEHHGKKEGYKSVWIGFSALVLFVVMSQFVLRLISTSETTAISEAMQVLFRGVPRIAFASMFAYLVAQNFDVWFYHFIHQKTGQKRLWLRNNLSTFTSQFIDSIIFFSIAFFGVVPFNILLQIIFTGYAVKLIVALLDTPFIYLSYFIKKEK